MNLRTCVSDLVSIILSMFSHLLIYYCLLTILLNNVILRISFTLCVHVHVCRACAVCLLSGSTGVTASPSRCMTQPSGIPILSPVLLYSPFLIRRIFDILVSPPFMSGWRYTCGRREVSSPSRVGSVVPASHSSHPAPRESENCPSANVPDSEL